MEYVIKLIEIEINYIIIEITPAIKLLSSSLLKCFLNCRNYEDFTIQSIDEMDTIYKIMPKKNFTIYDEVGLCIKGENINSNYIKVHLCKEYKDNKGLFVYEFPEINSGNYTFNLESLNDTNFKIEVHNQVICNGVSDQSYISTEKQNYSIDENINLKINIFDKDNKKAPNGKYFIYVKIEEIL